LFFLLRFAAFFFGFFFLEYLAVEGDPAVAEAGAEADLAAGVVLADSAAVAPVAAGLAAVGSQ
jgi:hypothetical protein